MTPSRVVYTETTTFLILILQSLVDKMLLAMCKYKQDTAQGAKKDFSDLAVSHNHARKKDLFMSPHYVLRDQDVGGYKHQGIGRDMEHEAVQRGAGALPYPACDDAKGEGKRQKKQR